jgi:hypothetical protein
LAILADFRPFSGEMSYRRMESSPPNRSIDRRICEVSAALLVCRSISSFRDGSLMGEHTDWESEKGSDTIDSGLYGGAPCGASKANGVVERPWGVAASAVG